MLSFVGSGIASSISLTHQYPQPSDADRSGQARHGSGGTRHPNLYQSFSKSARGLAQAQPDVYAGVSLLADRYSGSAVVSRSRKETAPMYPQPPILALSLLSPTPAAAELLATPLARQELPAAPELAGILLPAGDAGRISATSLLFAMGVAVQVGGMLQAWHKSVPGTGPSRPLGPPALACGSRE